MARNLRPEAGGDPTDQGPVPELTDHLPPARDLDDLPGASGRPDGGDDGRPQDQPDLDAFAARMGTDRIGAGDDERPGDDERAGDGKGWRERVTGRPIAAVRSIAAGSLRGLSRGSGAVSTGLDRLSRRIG